MRFVIAMIVASLLAATIFFACLTLSHQLNREILGDSPSNLTPEFIIGTGVEVSSCTMLKLNIVDALLTLRWVWVPVLVVLCLGVATLFPTSQAKLNADEVQSGA